MRSPPTSSASNYSTSNSARTASTWSRRASYRGGCCAKISKVLLAEGYLRHFEIRGEDGVAVSGALRIPLSHFLGFIGIAPDNEVEHSSVMPGTFGGNLDLKLATVGSTVWLPVQREGGHFYLGDVHAAPGDGELNGTTIECVATRLHVRFRLRRSTGARYPRLTGEQSIVTLGIAEELHEATAIAA